MPKEAEEQVLSNIRNTDDSWTAALDVPVAEPRTLEGKPWIRDYWPGSDVILKLAEHASTPDYHGIVYSSYVFVDSGWEAGNVIAARWEGSGEARRLAAVRVPMNIANLLLTTCDTNEGYTLSRALGNERYEDAKVDFYKDSITTPTLLDRKNKLFTWPDFLPEDLKIPTDQLYIISLRSLTDSEIQQLRTSIAGGEQAAEDASTIPTIYNWEGDLPTRTDVRHIFRQIYNNSPAEDQNRLVFFVDNILQGPSQEPQIIVALQFRPNNDDTVKVAPVSTENVMQVWRELNEGKGGERLMEIHSDIWSAEVVEDLREKRFAFPGQLIVLKTMVTFVSAC